MSQPTRVIQAIMTVTDVGEMDDDGKPGAQVTLHVHPANARLLADMLYKRMLVEIAVREESKTSPPLPAEDTSVCRNCGRPFRGSGLAYCFACLASGNLI